MNKHHAGAGLVMHSSLISEPACLGPYPKTLVVGDTQSTVFQEGNNGPFYLSEAKRQDKKYDHPTGKKKKRDLKKSELIDLLHTKIGPTFSHQTYCSLEDLLVLARNHEISVQVEADFKYEKSAMQKLAEDLSVLHACKIELLITPKYHCELAGEDGWGLFKNDYRRTPHAEKKGCDLFRSCVKKSLKRVTVEHIRRFSARARRYMLTYWLLDSPDALEGHGLSYHEIEQYVTKNEGPLQHRRSTKCFYSTSLAKITTKW